MTNLAKVNSCFTHFSEISDLIPSEYIRDDDKKCWFSTAPAFTTIRVNTLKCGPDDILTGLKIQCPDNFDGVYQHAIIRDCIVVGSWNIEEKVEPFESFKEVIVDVKCGNAVLRGANIFAPGVVAMQTGLFPSEKVNIYVDLSGKCTKGFSKRFEGEKLFIGHGKVIRDRHYLFESNQIVTGLAVAVEKRTSNVPSLYFSSDAGILQNLPSILCSHVLNPTSEHAVLDMCAAPGTKTSHLAALMRNKGTLIALDIRPKKILMMKEYLNKLGVTNVATYLWDSKKLISNTKTETNFDPPFSPCTFDRVLLDAPCSGLGQRPNLRNNIKRPHIQSFVKIQKAMFTEAVDVLKPGGFLVYSTCSITIEENEELVAWALQKFPIQLVRSSPMLGMPGYLVPGLNEIERYYVQRFGNSHNPVPEDDTIGFFIAKFTKV